MKISLVGLIVLVALLSGCGGGGGSVEHAYITTPNGFTFSIIDHDISYGDVLQFEESHLYAIQVRPGFQYTVYLDTTAGDSDLYLYYDYTLAPLSLMTYSDLSGLLVDSSTFYADFNGTVYIEVYGAESSQYLISVTEALVVN